MSLACTIYEFYNGSLKTFNYIRNVLQPDGKSIAQQEETLTVEVKPGYDTDTVVRYDSKGHEAFAYHQSGLNVRFSLADEDSKGNKVLLTFRRDGDNLIYTHTMDL